MSIPFATLAEQTNNWLHRSILTIGEHFRFALWPCSTLFGGCKSTGKHQQRKWMRKRQLLIIPPYIKVTYDMETTNRQMHWWKNWKIPGSRPQEKRHVGLQSVLEYGDAARRIASKSNFWQSQLSAEPGIQDHYWCQDPHQSWPWDQQQAWLILKAEETLKYLC